jgi:Arc/MetJ-type ribon-helix-helix transcriptional regulator
MSRKIMNISVPGEMALFVRRESKRRNYASVSEFVRALIREYEEEKILADVEKGRQEFREGKTKMLRSLNDLR